MLTLSSFVAAYLVFGFLASLLMRRGRPEDLDESLLASVVALPLVLALAAAVLASRARTLLTDGRSGPTARA
jgi:cyanate permease